MNNQNSNKNSNKARHTPEARLTSIFAKLGNEIAEREKIRAEERQKRKAKDTDKKNETDSP